MVCIIVVIIVGLSSSAVFVSTVYFEVFCGVLFKIFFLAKLCTY